MGKLHLGVNEIKTIEDFRCWLGYMADLANVKRPTVKLKMKSLIDEAMKLETYERVVITEYYDQLKAINTDSVDTGLEDQFLDAKRFARNSEDLRIMCESEFGKEQAFEHVINEFKKYINKTLAPLEGYDSYYPEFKKRVLKALDWAKRQQRNNNDNGAWGSLCRINLNISDNRGYFTIQLGKAKNSTGGKQSLYKPYKHKIIEYIKQTLLDKKNPKYLQKQLARQKIRDLIESNESGKLVHPKTFNNWSKEWQETGDISFSKK